MAYTYSLLASSTVGVGGASTITFNNIPQNYTDLVLKVSARTDGSNRTGYLSLNGNTTDASYSQRSVYGSGSGSFSGNGANRYMWYMDYASDTASTFGNTEFYFPNYSNTTNYKSFSVDSVEENNATLSYAYLIAGLWNSVTSISKIDLTAFSGSFTQYSTAYLYGIRVEL